MGRHERAYLSFRLEMKFKRSAPSGRNVAAFLSLWWAFRWLMIICRPRFTALIASVRCSSCSLSLSVSHFVSTHWVLRCVEQLVQRRPEDERSTVGTFSSAELLALPWHQYDYGFRKCGRILIGHSQLHLPAPVDTRLVKIVFPFCLIRVPFTFFLPPTSRLAVASPHLAAVYLGKWKKASGASVFQVTGWKCYKNEWNFHLVACFIWRETVTWYFYFFILLVFHEQTTADGTAMTRKRDEHQASGTAV